MCVPATKQRSSRPCFLSETKTPAVSETAIKYTILSKNGVRKLLLMDEQSKIRYIRRLARKTTYEIIRPGAINSVNGVSFSP